MTTPGKAHLRLTLRHPPGATAGAKHIVARDCLEVVAPDGAVIADLSSYLAGSTITRECGDAHRWTLEMFAGDLVTETEGK